MQLPRRAAVADLSERYALELEALAPVADIVEVESPTAEAFRRRRRRLRRGHHLLGHPLRRGDHQPPGQVRRHWPRQRRRRHGGRGSGHRRRHRRHQHAGRVHRGGGGSRHDAAALRHPPHQGAEHLCRRERVGQGTTAAQPHPAPDGAHAGPALVRQRRPLHRRPRQGIRPACHRLRPLCERTDHWRARRRAGLLGRVPGTIRLHQRPFAAQRGNPTTC